MNRSHYHFLNSNNILSHIIVVGKYIFLNKITNASAVELSSPKHPPMKSQD